MSEPLKDTDSDGSDARSRGFLRVLGPWQGVALVVGTVIGSGIFMTPRSIAGEVGPWGVGAILAVWVVCGLLSLAGALAYAELAAMLPGAGGQYIYLREAYGRLPAFLFGWMEFWVARAGSVATVAVGFAQHAVLVAGGVKAGGGYELGETAQNPAVPWIAVTCVLTLSVVNYLGARWGGAVQVLFTVAKVGVLVGLVAVAAFSPVSSVQHLQPWLAAGGGGLVGAFGAAMIAGLWAYDGWNNGATVSEEMRDPQRNVPLSLLVGTATITVVYLGANLAYHALLPLRVVAETSVPAAMAGQAALGGVGAALIAGGAMISTFGSVNGMMLSGPRIFFAMARDQLFFRQLGALHPVYRTPHAAILLQGAWSAALIVLANQFELKKGEFLFDTLFTYVIFASWIFYALSVAAVIVLRRRQPEAHRPYRAWGYPVVPLAFVLVAVWFVANTLVESWRPSLMGLLIIVSGLPAYYAWNRSARPRGEDG